VPDQVDELIAERKKTHGPYKEVAALAQATKHLWRTHPGWAKLTDVQKDTLEHNAGKIARVLVGDPMYKDHWIDQVGYLKRVLEEIDECAASS